MYYSGSTFTFVAISVTMLSIVLYKIIPAFTSGHIFVNTSYGKLEGYSSISREEKIYFGFRSIPYASPPIGNLRFQPPIIPQKWNGTRDASAFGSMCTQINLVTGLISGSEDCLFLNVYTPNLGTEESKDLSESKQLLPVLLFIHGGGFLSGHSEHGADYLMDEDVVLVTINYRLGSFGFLNMGTKDIRGNMGLKDQNMALRWVKENIEYFGGDPNRVTLVGISAGSASVHLHTLSPMSKGLFSSFIAISGTALHRWAFVKRPIEQAKWFAEKMNCSVDEPKALLHCLQALPAKKICETHAASVEEFVLPENRFALFAPTMEVIQDNDAFITTFPAKLTVGSTNNIPGVFSTADGEGLVYTYALFLSESLRKKLMYNWNYSAPILFEYDHLPNNDTRNKISTHIREKYFGNKEFRLESPDSIARLFSDSRFFEGVHDSVKAASVSSPTYAYLNTYQPVFGLSDVIFGMSLKLPVIFDLILSFGHALLTTDRSRPSDNHYGATHGTEENLLFSNFLNKLLASKEDIYFSKQLIRTFAYFAKHGEPPENLHWPAVKSNHPIKFMKFGSKSEVINDPLQKRIEFWRKLRSKYNF